MRVYGSACHLVGTGGEGVVVWEGEGWGVMGLGEAQLVVSDGQERGGLSLGLGRIDAACRVEVGRRSSSFGWDRRRLGLSYVLGW